MALTLKQANALLSNVTTVEELRTLISQLDVTGQGSTSIPISLPVLHNEEMFFGRCSGQLLHKMNYFPFLGYLKRPNPIW